MAQEYSTEENLIEAEKALSNGDRKASGILISRVLKNNFTNESAWLLLYRWTGSTQPFEDFQIEFAARYYPDRVHLLPQAGADWLGILEVGSADAPALPTSPSPAIELRICPECAQSRIGRKRHCDRCGFDYAMSAGKPPIAAEPVIVPQPALMFSSTQQTPTPPSRFTAKKIVAAIGMGLIVMAGLVTWSSSREWLGIFNGGYHSYGTIGLANAYGLLSTGAAVLGLIKLFTIGEEKVAHLLSTGGAIISALAAFGFLKSGTWGYSGGYEGFFVDYSSLGAGVYMVFVGAAIALGAFLIPSRSRVPNACPANGAEAERQAEAAEQTDR